MAALPTGTVTFLFIDIEGSTTHWEQAKQEDNEQDVEASCEKQLAAMQARVRAHSALCAVPYAVLWW